MKYLFCLFALALPASAALTINLPGTVETATWTGLNNSNSTAVAGPHAGDAGSTSSAVFSVVSGSPSYTSTGSGIYSGFMGAGAVFAISDASPITGLETLVFQMTLNQDPTLVSLFINGSTDPVAALPATHSVKIEAGANFEYAWQFDLSGVAEPITSYSFQFSTALHTLISSTSSIPVSVHAGDSYVQVIPEPTAGLLGLAGAGLLFTRRRRG